MTRPIGVTIIAILAIVAAVFYLLGALPILGLGGVLTAIGMTEFASLAGAVGLTVGVIALALAVADLVFGIGALQLKSWAWTLGVTLFSASIVFAIASMLLVGLAVSNVVSGVIALAVLVYLFTPDVRTAFGHGAHMTPSGHTPMPTS
ncbi:MAG: hypothetical protein HY876_03935 [Coriobacteriales bacterium]|nr:hypothetical protein [Coriobacteriales bacterium]